MRKSNYLTSLRREGCWYIATMYNMNNGFYHDQSFLYYSKKEIISKLRHDYDCVVSHDFY